MDKLFDQVRNTFDKAEQTKVLEKIHEKYVDDALFIMITHDVNPRAMSPKVKGFVQAQNWFQDFSTDHTWRRSGREPGPTPSRLVGGGGARWGPGDRCLCLPNGTPIPAASRRGGGEVLPRLQRADRAFDAALHPQTTHLRHARGVRASAWSASCSSTSRPGDPLSAVLPATLPRPTIDEMRAAYGFDKPLPVQYLIWLWHVLHGDLGVSIATGRPVLGEVSRAVVNSLILASVGDRDRLHLRNAVRLRGGLSPQLARRRAGLGALGLRGQRAALLARHGAGDRVLGDARLAAAHRGRAPTAPATGGRTSTTCATWCCPASRCR